MQPLNNGKPHDRIEQGNKLYEDCVGLNEVATAALKNEDLLLLENYRLTDIQKKKDETDDNNLEDQDGTKDNLE